MISIKNLIIGIAIFILTVSVSIYGINTFYGHPPDYNEYCPADKVRAIFNKTECENENYTWTPSMSPMYDMNSKPIPSTPETNGYCDTYSKCQRELENATKIYDTNLFYITLPLGIIIIAIGGIAFGLEFIGAGLMAGGVGVLIYGVGSVWSFADDWIKFIICLIGLIFVIIIGYYINKKVTQRKKSQIILA